MAEALRRFYRVFLILIKELFLSSLCIVITEIIFSLFDFIYMFHMSELVIDDVCVYLHLNLFLGRVACVPVLRGLS